MLGRSKTSKPAADAKIFSGWNNEGGFFRSEVKIENSVTRFVDYAVRETLQEFYSPADVRFLVLRESEATRGAFRPQTLEAWEKLGRFWHWPLAFAHTSAEETIRSLGGRCPWSRDENAWTKWCDSAERKYAHESRLLEPAELDAFKHTLVGGFSPLVAS